MKDFPCIGFFPALPLAKNLELGDWVVGPSFDDVPWRPDPFKTLAEAVIASCTRRDFKNAGARLWHRVRGFDGTTPGDGVLERITAAVRFAALNANDQIFDRYNIGHYLATTENAALYLLPIDETKRYITHRRGGALNEGFIMGHKIGEEPIALPDAVMAISRPIQASAKLASAIFSTLGNSGDNQARRIGLAIEWHGAVMANPDAVTPQQRIIGLKTGFEVLLGTDDSRECAKQLRRLFEEATSKHREGLPWVGLLWSPNERTDLIRPYETPWGEKKVDRRSELEDWFMTLVDARNKIIHEGQLSVTTYEKPVERPHSRYVGSLFWTGERLLREAIKAGLGPEILLCGRFAMRDALVAAFAELPPDQRIAWEQPVADQVSVQGEPETPPAASQPQRDLSALLTTLDCGAANEVLLERDGRGAKTENVTISIKPAERTLLKNAGAEEELSEVWLPCD